jgi:hypothetical protein
LSDKIPCQAKTSNKLRQRLRPDKRDELRHTITLPVKVAGSDSHKTPWSELAETVNVSSGGLALRLSRKVMIEDILYVEFPLPARFQLQRDIEPSATYKSYARVRYIEMHERQQIVRLQFLRTPTHTAAVYKTLLVSAKF